jgi:hypothetical protein
MTHFRSSSDHKTPARKPRSTSRGAAARPSHQPRLEALEDRFLPATSTSAVISGHVFYDINSDGLRQSGEPLLANSTIVLHTVRNGQDTVIGTTTTDANGYYQFNQDATVPPGLQTITKTITIPTTPTNFSLGGLINQFDPSLGNLQSVQIANAGSITSTIAVENTSTSSPSSITATVSGQLQLVGPNAIGMNTNLSQNAGNFSATTYDGQLDFGGSSGMNFGPKTANGQQSVTLTGVQMAPFIGTGSVQFTENATATSTANGGGNLVASITSTGTAAITVTYNYLLDTSIKPGNYTVVQPANPPGYIGGKMSSNGLVLSNPPDVRVIPITISGNNIVAPNNDFAELKASSLSGYVYGDISPTGYNDGIKEADEPGFPAVTIILDGTDDLGPVHRMVQTDANGYYDFAQLRPGLYTITESPPAGWLDGKDTIGTPGGTTLQDKFTNINLPAGYDGVNNNFGHLLPAALSGYVYSDSGPGAAFNDGVFEPGEHGIAGSTITLTGTDDHGPVTKVAVTDANGFYNFVGLRPGTYQIQQDEPPGFIDGKDTIGTQGGQTGKDVFYGINVTPGMSGQQNNFGELPPVVSVAIPPELPPTLTPPVTPATPPVIPVVSKGQLVGTGNSQGDPSYTADARFVNTIYRAILGRDVDTGSLAGWLVYLHGGGTRAQFVDMVWHSDENRTRQVVALFNTILQTGPTPTDLNFYVGLLRMGENELQIAASIASGPAAAARYPTYASYLDLLYNLAYGTSADANAQAQWQGLANDRGSLAMQIFNSPASLNNLVVNLYQTLLGRTPGAAELQSWVGLIQQGWPYDALVETFLSSAEFSAHIGA